MRTLLLAALLLLPGAAHANLCFTVEERSHGQIECQKDSFGYLLEYESWIARRAVLASGRYDDMISALCADGGLVRESWTPPFQDTQLRTTTCQKKE